MLRFSAVLVTAWAASIVAAGLWAGLLKTGKSSLSCWPSHGRKLPHYDRIVCTTDTVTVVLAVAVVVTVAVAVAVAAAVAGGA